MLTNTLNDTRGGTFECMENWRIREGRSRADINCVSHKTLSAIKHHFTGDLGKR